MSDKIPPYIPKTRGDVIRAADWNALQVLARQELRGHAHTGGEQGTQLGTAALQDRAVTSEKLADGSVTPAKLDPELRARITAAGELGGELERLRADVGAASERIDELRLAIEQLEAKIEALGERG